LDERNTLPTRKLRRSYVETVFYDPEAFVAPLRSTTHWTRISSLDGPTLRPPFVECLSNIVNVDGKPTQLSPNNDRYINYYVRPWAQELGKIF
jgi:hypothetical protein